MLPPFVEACLTRREPFLWLNDSWRSLPEAQFTPRVNLERVREAETRFHRFSGLLMRLFPELSASHGAIESALHSAEKFQRAMGGRSGASGRWFIKGDHALPVVGSIKARGGIYEVLLHAQDIALRHGMMRPEDDPLILASAAARSLFASYQIAVGSTGNLGMSIGLSAAALGFQARVHMSSDAKTWKKARLRACGVQVIEHQGDYGVAVASGRGEAQGNPRIYFVDDENSERLFWGYSVAALGLKRQLSAQGVPVDAEHPLFVYLPCGVGGAPGGITFGLRQLFKDHVHCFFAEPVESPCMLIRLASFEDRPLSVEDVGLGNRTEADGLAVAQASEFVAKVMRPLVSGVFTVADNDLFRDLYLLEQSEGLRVEPSAAAGFRGPAWLLASAAGQRYLERHGLTERVDQAAHILWTTGGALMPDEEYGQFHSRGREAVQRTMGLRYPSAEHSNSYESLP